MAEKINYQELKKQARELGINIFQKTAEVLQKEVNQVLLEKNTPPGKFDENAPEAFIPEEKTELPKEMPSPIIPPEIPDNIPQVVQVPVSNKTFNSIDVMNGKEKIRTFTLAIHGKEFGTLAALFAEKKKYQLVTYDTGKNISCPSCGHSFAPKI
jgi:molybdopterin/thiamine biosynthesis adenylyltransferase